MTNQEIDEAVALELGWQRNDIGRWIHPNAYEKGWRVGDINPAPYSTDIKAAWEIVHLIPHITLWRFGDERWRITWLAPKSVSGTESLDAETAPLAICKAFLAMEGVPLAADVDVKEGAD